MWCIHGKEPTSFLRELQPYFDEAPSLDSIREIESSLSVPLPNYRFLRLAEQLDYERSIRLREELREILIASRRICGVNEC